MRLTPLGFLLTLAVAVSTAFAKDGGKVQMPRYEGKYYVIYSDLPPQEVKEADLRMTRMAEEYHERTRDFSGAIRQKMPFYLFRNESDYIDAGGIKGSAGVFDPSSQVLMAVVDEKSSANTWHVVQHEGFHQFAAAVIGGELPIWVNEGLAEYFGEGIFTGDGFVTGVIPDWRLKRVQDELDHGFKPVHTLMSFSHREWNDEMSIVNYDQAWSMVHFLANADGGKYQSGFVKFMRGIASNVDPERAWQQAFGSDAGFETQWRAYWSALKPGATADAYTRATLQTLTGAVGRAYVKQQTFDSVDSLVKAIENGTNQYDPRDWVPPSVYDVALDNLKQLEDGGTTFTIQPANKALPRVIAEMPGGLRFLGAFTVNANHIGRITVTKSSAGGFPAPSHQPRP